MCGISGTVGVRDESAVARMTSLQAHRGPDDSGVHFSPHDHVGLGHCRLSIIDLSAAGHQPMPNDDETVWIVFNGEVYNFRELRRTLEPRYKFRSNTDTEVVLRLYEEKGADAVRDLNGMFAFAIYDRRRTGANGSGQGTLLLARDRLGIKPLYYHQTDGRLVFSSEIKAILGSGVYSPELNRQGFHDYLTYLYVPCPETMFRGILQLPPAHVLELDVGTGAVETRRYWQPDIEQAANRPTNAGSGYQFDKRRLRKLLTDSTRSQMVSDVPLGLFLSGGVDSGIIAGLMAESSERPVKTYTVVFRGHGMEYYNEQDAARVVSDRFGTDHSEIEVELDDPAEMLGLVDYFDQPFGNPTSLLMYLMSKHTRSETTVALCGAGGDELFAGYPRYQAAQLARWMRWLPGPMLAGTRRLVEIIPDDYRTMRLRRIRQFLNGLDPDFVRQFTRWTYFFDEEQKSALLAYGDRRDSGAGGALLPSDRVLRALLEGSPVKDFGNRVLHLDIQSFLLDNLLEYTDKMSMAVGLEVRVPYLDHRVVEHALAVPFRHKLRGLRSKVILRETFSDMLPASSVSSPKKGFNVPLAAWMRDHLDSYFDSEMSKSEVDGHGVFNWDFIQHLRREHMTGRRDNSYQLYAIIMFDAWYRKYILETEPRRFGPCTAAGSRTS